MQVSLEGNVDPSLWCVNNFKGSMQDSTSLFVKTDPGIMMGMAGVEEKHRRWMRLRTYCETWV